MFIEEKNEVVKKKYYDFEVAVDTEQGLKVPNVKNVQNKSILDLAREISDLAEKARKNELKLRNVRGGTFIITNYGSIGGRFATPIINYPEAAILGTGRIETKPKVIDGEIKKRKLLPLSLSYDHRINDGAEAAKFLNRVIKHIEDPYLLLIDE